MTTPHDADAALIRHAVQYQMARYVEARRAARNAALRRAYDGELAKLAGLLGRLQGNGQGGGATP